MYENSRVKKFLYILRLLNIFYHQRVLNFVTYFFWVYWDDHVVSVLYLSVQCFTLILSQMLNQPGILGLNPTCSCCAKVPQRSLSGFLEEEQLNQWGWSRVSDGRKGRKLVRAVARFKVIWGSEGHGKDFGFYFETWSPWNIMSTWVTWFDLHFKRLSLAAV